MLTVAVLGLVEVRRDGVPAAVPAGLTTELLVRLALDAGRPVRAQRIVEELWPAGTRLNTLQAKVSQLRRALGDPAALAGGAAGYTLAVDPDHVDALRALRLADEGAARLAAGDLRAAAATCQEGRALFGAEVLPAAGAADWVLPHRVRLEEARLRLVEDGLAARLGLGGAGEVTGELEALVAAHPLRERLWALLVTALYRGGRQSDALAAHRRVTRLLAEELGVDPGPELQALERKVLTHALGTPRPGNLPALSTPLVGRGDDLAALGAAVAEHRLVTLVGPAGVGKTRLAIEAARDDAAPDGAWLVRLEGATATTDLAAALPGQDGVDGLRGADLLLVLDNCEHLVEQVGALVTAVLDTAPHVRVLATSQRPLGLDGETVRALAPLPEADAVALFARRAAERGRAVDPGAAVAALCRALDGLPLAIELAAARTRILTVAEITRRLDDRFALLADPTAARPERRRTLAAALSWSYDLLFPDDQRGLWALAPFPGGATPAAVEHVLAALDVPAGAALDVVERLVDRSLVTVDDTGGGTRYRLLDSVRAYAAERAVEAGAADTAADAMVDWLAALAGTVAAGVRGHGQAELVAATGAERATIDAALDRVRDPVAGLRIAVGFGWAWVLLDDPGAAARLRAARLAAPHAPPGDRAAALRLEGWLEAMSGDLHRGRAAMDTARALADDDVTRWYDAFVLVQEGRAAEALAALERCRAAFAGTGWAEGATALLTAFAHIGLGDPAAGRAACEEAIGILAPLGDAWGLIHAEGALGVLAEAAGQFADAAHHHARAAAAAEDLGFLGQAALHRGNLGRAQHAAGDPAAAASLRHAIAGAEQAGDLRRLASTRVTLAEVLHEDGDRDGARELLIAASRWFGASGAGESALLARCLLAVLRVEDGDLSAVPELRAVHAAAKDAGDRRTESLAQEALRPSPAQRAR